MTQFRVGGEFNRDFSEDFWIGELVERAIRKQLLDGLVRKSMMLDGTIMPKLVVSGEIAKQGYIEGSVLEVGKIKVFEKEDL